MKSAHDLVLAAKSRIQEVPLADAEQAIRDAQVLIDVREADEYAAGHIPGAVNVPWGKAVNEDGTFSMSPDLDATTDGQHWHWAGNVDTGEPYLATWTPGLGRCTMLSIGFEPRSTVGPAADAVRSGCGRQGP